MNLCFCQLVVATICPCGEMIWWKRGAEPQKVTVEYLKKCLDEKKAQELVKAYQEPCVSSTSFQHLVLCQLVFFSHGQCDEWIHLRFLQFFPSSSEVGIAFWSGKNCWKSMVGCHLCWFPSFPGCRFVLFLSELIIGFLHNGCFIFSSVGYLYIHIYNYI